MTDVLTPVAEHDPSSRKTEGITVDLLTSGGDALDQSVIHTVDPSLDRLIAAGAGGISSVIILQVPAAIFCLHRISGADCRALCFLRERKDFSVAAVPYILLLHRIAADTVGNQFCLVIIPADPEQHRKSGGIVSGPEIVDPFAVQRNGILDNKCRIVRITEVFHLKRKHSLFLFIAITPADRADGTVRVENKILIPELTGTGQSISILIQIIELFRLLDPGILRPGTIFVAVAAALAGIVPSVHIDRCFSFLFRVLDLDHTTLRDGSVYSLFRHRHVSSRRPPQEKHSRADGCSNQGE